MADQVLDPLLKRVLASLAHVAIETETLQAVLVFYSPEAALALAPTRDVIRAKWKPFLDSLEKSTPESLESILQKFEGPVQ